MKSRNLFAAGIMALSLTGLASADVTINITGSTAFRAAAHDAILAVMTGETYAYNLATLADSDRAIFVGTVAGITGTTTIRTGWAGSGSGIAAVALAQNNNIYLPIGTTTSASPGTASAPGLSTGIARFTLSDVNQVSTPTKTPVLQAAIVGIIPFQFVASQSGNIPALNNVTPQALKTLLKNGTAPLSLFTSNVADESTTVIPTGRSSTSGTRITALAEIGYGINTAVAQYIAPVYSGDTVTALTSSSATSGLSLGGDVATLLGKTSANVSLDGDTAGPQILISYLANNDAADAVTNGAKVLSYNGVPNTDANVRNGSYTFWGYQNLLNIASLSADEATFRTAFIAQIPSNIGSAGVANNALVRVTRSGDGGAITPK